MTHMKINFRKHGLMLSALISLGFAAITQDVFAQTIYVSRVGDGSVALSSAGAAIFLDEYKVNTDGTVSLITSFAAPTTNSGSNKALVDSGSASSEGGLSFAGNYLTIAGYDATPGTASVVNSGAARGVGLFNLTTGTFDTSTSLTDAYVGSSNNIRSAVTADGTNLYTAGTASTTGGVRYTTDGNTTSSAVETLSTNTREVDIFNNTLYFSTGSATGVGKVGIYQLGTSGTLPNSSNSSFPLTPVAIVTDTGSSTNLSSPYGFTFVNDSNGTTASVYVADSSKGLVKYTYTLGSSTLATYDYTIAFSGTGSGLSSITFGGTDINGNNILYGVNGASSSTTGLYSITDTGSSSAFSLQVSGTTSAAFRGVDFAPAAAPEPSGFVAIFIGTGGLGLLVVRRRAKMMSAV